MKWPKEGALQLEWPLNHGMKNGIYDRCRLIGKVGHKAAEVLAWTRQIGSTTRSFGGRDSQCTMQELLVNTKPNHTWWNPKFRIDVNRTGNETSLNDYLTHLQYHQPLFSATTKILPTCQNAGPVKRIGMQEFKKRRLYYFPAMRPARAQSSCSCTPNRTPAWNHCIPKWVPIYRLLKSPESEKTDLTETALANTWPTCQIRGQCKTVNWAIWH
jgi:hypothetical protein